MNTEFIAHWEETQKIVHANAISKKFWDNERNAGESIALIHSELSECLEALRYGNPPSDKIPEFSGAEEELADTVIRIMDFAEGMGFNVAGAIKAKHQYNLGRQEKHGKKF